MKINVETRLDVEVLAPLIKYYGEKGMVLTKSTAIRCAVESQYQNLVDIGSIAVMNRLEALQYLDNLAIQQQQTKSIRSIAPKLSKKSVLDLLD